MLLTLRCLGWGALSVPRKNLGQLLVAAANTACRCSSRFKIGKQKAWGRRPPCQAAHTLPAAPLLQQRHHAKTSIHRQTDRQMKGCTDNRPDETHKHMKIDRHEDKTQQPEQDTTLATPECRTLGLQETVSGHTTTKKASHPSQSNRICKTETCSRGHIVMPGMLHCCKGAWSKPVYPELSIKCAMLSPA